MSNSDLLLCDIENGIASLTLNTPESINALSESMIGALSNTLDEISVDKSVKAVILKTAGKHFCAGHNLKEMNARRSDEDGGFQYFQDLFAQCSQMMLKIVNLPQPVIAQVSGIATAAGCQLVATCDLAVASEEASFATSGVSIGLFCSTPMVALSRNLHRKHAMHMLLTGEFIPADQAKDLGLVNDVVPIERLEDTTRHMAETIANKSAAAIKVGKQAFYQQMQMPLEDAYKYTGRVMAENMMAQDAEAGIGAFTRKEPMPEWVGE